MISFYKELKKCQEKSDEKCLDFNISIIMDYLKEGFIIKNSDLKYIGRGNFGYAFATDDKVVKITSDSCEYDIAESLVGKTNEYLADIYGVYKVNKDYFIIVQEKLSMNEGLIKATSHLLMEIFDNYNTTLQEIVKYEYKSGMLNEEQNLLLSEPCPPFCCKVVSHAYNASEELEKKTSYRSDDFNVFNFGIKSNGNVAFFDHTIY